MGSAVEEDVELVGDVKVVEHGDVRVVPQCRGRVPMAEAGLRLEELALVDQVRSHAVAETVERWVGHPGGTTEAAELVGQGIGGQVGLTGRGRRKQPVVHRVASEALPGG